MDEDCVMKIADFGLARKVLRDADYYKKVSDVSIYERGMNMV